MNKISAFAYYYEAEFYRIKKKKKIVEFFLKKRLMSGLKNSCKILGKVYKIKKLIRL